MMFDPSQADVRRFFCESFRKHRDGQILTPLESLALETILVHPEYHATLSDQPAALAADYPVEAGRSNPFLHLSMHLAIAEQLSIDQPPGIRSAMQRLAARMDSEHEAAHLVMECLGEVVWEAQRDKRMPDSAKYLDCILRHAG